MLHGLFKIAASNFVYPPETNEISWLLNNSPIFFVLGIKLIFLIFFFKIFDNSLLEDDPKTKVIFEKSNFLIASKTLINAASYPLEKIHSNLNMIHTLKNRYNCPIGHSDHTHGTEIPPLAVAAGADVIEKHFTSTPKLRESDNFFSVTKNEVKEIKFKIDQVRQYMGSDSIENIPTEDYMWSFRRKT